MQEAQGKLFDRNSWHCYHMNGLTLDRWRLLSGLLRQWYSSWGDLLSHVVDSYAHHYECWVQHMESRDSLTDHKCFDKRKVWLLWYPTFPNTGVSHRKHHHQFQNCLLIFKSMNTGQIDREDRQDWTRRISRYNSLCQEAEIIAFQALLTFLP